METNFISFCSAFEASFKKQIPGKKGQQPLKPYLKISKNLPSPKGIHAKKAAVMALLIERQNEPHIVLIERSSYDGVHSKQIAFPGGKVEMNDASYLDAALRETKEEIGIEKQAITVIGSLTEVYVLASNFLVFPFVGYINQPVNYIKDTNEVNEILEIPISDFLQPKLIKEKQMKSAFGLNLMAPYYDIQNKIIWGATAMMLSEISFIVKNIDDYEQYLE
ncbi:MAG: CoA pyrophosphatase [Chitinophagales bacterium]